MARVDLREDGPGNATEVECVGELRRAAALLHPLRLAILQQLRTPRSATDVAATLRLPRQKVNYHVRQLARARFIRKAGRRQRRGLKDQCWLLGAKAFLLLPSLLGSLAPETRAITDRLSAAYLLALCSTAQRELGDAVRAAEAEGTRIATLAMDAEVRFETAAQRQAFTAALAAAFTNVIAEHASPFTTASGGPGKGRPYRLLLGAYPMSKDVESASLADANNHQEER